MALPVIARLISRCELVLPARTVARSPWCDGLALLELGAACELAELFGLALPFEPSELGAALDWCWEWRGHYDRDGYGRVRWEHMGALAHRVMAIETFGDRLDRREVHHRCENEGCINPAHLEPLRIKEHDQRHRSLKRERSTPLEAGREQYRAGRARRARRDAERD